MPKAVTTSISLPFPLERELSKEARTEHRTKSGMIQEAIRYYLENKRWKKIQKEISERARRLGLTDEDAVEQLIDEVRKGSS